MDPFLFYSMRELYNLSPKSRWRILLLLFSVMFILLASGLIENYNLQRVNEDISSMYADRLIPSSQIYYVTEYLFEKRVVLESIENRSDFDEEEVINRLRSRNSEMDSLISNYYQTYLVEDEAEHVQTFDRNLKIYLETEDRMAELMQNGRKEAALRLYETVGRDQFRSVIEELNILADVQLRVGQELLEKSRNELGYNKLLYYVRVLVIITIGIFILVIIRTSRLMHQPEQNYRMN
ncbi:MCP four helix bundle domain-containing protein [Balneola sp. MJW-20]|uniref:MCP four helix bundle domain-containing protein n=1 Tax=Gracilimonas aurantiaca TaxID=3234185 RepID=UPI0034676FAE